MSSLYFLTLIYIILGQNQKLSDNKKGRLKVDLFLNNISYSYEII